MPYNFMPYGVDEERDTERSTNLLLSPHGRYLVAIKVGFPQFMSLWVISYQVKRGSFMNTGSFQANSTHRLLLAVTFLAATTNALVVGCGATEAAGTPTTATSTISARTTSTTGVSTTGVSTTGVSTTAATEAVSKPPKVGETAPDFGLEAISGEKVKLSEVSKQGPVVLVMLRGYPGYQCPICTIQVGQLMDNAKQFADAKARVLLVYPGPAEGLKAHADDFVKGKDIPKNFDLLLDPDYTFTNLYGLRWDAKGETAYPSTFVLDSARKVLFAKVSRSHGDRAKVEDVLAALPK